MRGVARKNIDSSKADRALQQSELRYRRLFESAKDGILILEPEAGCIVDVNPFMTELTGYPRDYFVGKLVWEIGLLQHADDVKAAFVELQARDYSRYDCLPLNTIDASSVTQLRDSIREQRTGDVELQNYRKDGTSFWNHVVVTPVLDDRGRLTNFVGVQTDVRFVVDGRRPPSHERATAGDPPRTAATWDEGTVHVRLHR